MSCCALKSEGGAEATRREWRVRVRHFMSLITCKAAVPAVLEEDILALVDLLLDHGATGGRLQVCTVPYILSSSPAFEYCLRLVPLFPVLGRCQYLQFHGEMRLPGTRHSVLDCRFK